MVDRIQNVNASPYRVDETLEDQNRRNQQENPESDEQKKKEKDNFSKNKNDALKKISATNPKLNIGVSSLEVFERMKKEASDPNIRLHDVNPDEEITEVTHGAPEQPLVEQDFWFSTGMVNADGRPRMKIIATYAVIVTVLILSAIFLVRLL